MASDDACTVTARADVLRLVAAGAGGPRGAGNGRRRPVGRRGWEPLGTERRGLSPARSLYLPSWRCPLFRVSTIVASSEVNALECTLEEVLFLIFV